MTLYCPYKEETKTTADFCMHNLQHEQLSVVMCGFAIFRPGRLGGWILNWGPLQLLVVMCFRAVDIWGRKWPHLSPLAKTGPRFQYLVPSKSSNLRGQLHGQSLCFNHYSFLPQKLVQGSWDYLFSLLARLASNLANMVGFLVRVFEMPSPAHPRSAWKCRVQ